MINLSWSLLNPLFGISKRVWGKRVVITRQSEAANFEVSGTLRWVRPDWVRSLENEKRVSRVCNSHLVQAPNCVP